MRRIGTAAWAETAFVLLLPPALFFAYGVSPFNQGLFLDANIYTGYINNFQDLIDRFGLTYYSVRFGLILPGLVLTRVFGAEVGYYALAYVFYVVAGGPLYLAMRKHFGVAGAGVAYVTLASSVWVARTILWHYVDSAVVAYLTGGLGLLLLDPARHRRVVYTLIGALGALAVHSNAFAAAYVALAVVPYAVMGRGALRSRLPSDAACAAAGIVGVTLVGVVFYGVTSGDWNMFRATFRIVGSGNELGVGYRPTLADWYLRRPWLLYPGFVLAGAGLVWLRPRARCRVLGAALLYAAVCVLFFAAWDRYSVGWPFFFYVSTLAPAVVTLACVIQAVVVTTSGLSSVQALIAAAAIAAAPPVSMALGAATRPATFTLLFAASAVALVVLAAFPRRWPAIAVVCALFAGVSHWQFVARIAGEDTSDIMIGQPPYSRVFRGPDPFAAEFREFHRGSYRMIVRLIALMPRFADDGKPLLFWYGSPRVPPGQIDLSIRFSMIQSAYLWAYSRLQGGERRSMPDIGSRERERLTAGSPFHLALLAATRADLDAARVALAREGVRFSPVLERTLCEQTRCILVELLAVRASAGSWLSGGSGVSSPLLDADARALAKTLERNVYGRFGKARAVTVEGERLVFQPTSRDDHLATPFLRVAGAGVRPPIGVRLTARMPERGVGRCTMILQKPSFEILAKLACRSSDEGTEASVYELALPPDATAFRVVFETANGRKADLPSKLRIELFPIPAPSRAAGS